MEKNQAGQKKSRIKTLLIVLAVVIVLGAIILYFTGGSSSPNETSEGVSTTEGSRATIPEPDFSVLESEAFARFKVWSVIPVTPGETGKDNPFGE